MGHWQDPRALEKLDGWMRAAAAFSDGHDLRVVRFGDNMREVAVTEGDKVEAQVKFGLVGERMGVSGNSPPRSRPSPPQPSTDWSTSIAQRMNCRRPRCLARARNAFANRRGWSSA